MKLAGKVALVTGSNRGIGRGIAVEMAREGADVTLNYNTHEAEAEAVAREIRGLGRRAIVCQADVSKREAVDHMVQETLRAFGKIDICVNNAASTVRKPFLELSGEEFQWVLGVSLMSVFHTSQACARDMVRRGQGGAILIISSVHAFIPFRTSLAYNACKAGINHMGYTMAEELLPHRIRVNVIEPGWIDTPGERRFVPESQIYELGKKLPWGRLGTIEELGKAAVFLCSEDASYITAACLRVDGGFWLPARSADSS
ncbi:MAG: glucose 1-dehydrogenase [Planctomycetes bacterium]|nr:glucose 1-dehydrogenase [Planctomycetota bacterium]